MCFVLDREQHDYTLFDAGCQPWVFINIDARGYYRTEYAPEILRAMAPHVETQFTAPERLSLLDDEWALVRAGRHSVSDYLTLASGHAREHNSGVLEEVGRRLGFVHDYLTSDATRTRFETFTHALLRPLFDEIGFTSAPSDTDDRRSLRATVIASLGIVGRDPDVVARARATLDRALSGGAALEPTQAGAIVTTAAIHGDAALFDALASAAEKAAGPEEHDRYLYALGDFREAALVDRGLKLALTPQLRSQDTALYLAHFFGNPDARSRALSFVTGNWAALEPKVTIFGGDTNLIRSMSAFCDAGSRDRIAAFFAEHKLPAAARTLEQTLEQITNCIGLREKQTPAVGAWLAAR
jgi:aminopeptidase N